MQIFDSLDISSSGLSVQRRKLTAIASNLANVDTTRTDEGGPYKSRRSVMLEAPKMSKFSTMLERAGNRLRMTNGKHRPEGRMSPGEFFLDSGVLSQEVGLKVATWQLVLVDMLFLCLAVGMGLWFRSWLQR